MANYSQHVQIYLSWFKNTGTIKLQSISQKIGSSGHWNFQVLSNEKPDIMCFRELANYFPNA